MYTLIADSGSTKTDWILCRNREILAQVRTAGLNPYFHTKEDINKEIEANLKPGLASFVQGIGEIHFYGAGCSTESNCSLVRDSLKTSLKVEKVNVSHDLLAAARALCGRKRGIAGILGTGSNSGLYDGKEIIENVPSTGYLWSDYGGGSQIGKFLIRDYFEGRLPREISIAFEAAGYNRETILENVYKRSMPSRYLAGVSKFVSTFKDHSYIQKLLTECFDSFFEQQISKYTDSRSYPINTIGSVGYFFRDTLSEVAGKHGFTTGRIVQSPVEGLLEYHSAHS